MSKGWGRRPAFVDRAEYDASWDRIFTKNPDSSSDQPVSADGVLAGKSADSPPAGHPTADTSIPVEFGMHPCDVADTMTPFFRDGRSRA